MADWDNTPPVGSALPRAWADVKAVASTNVDTGSAITSVDNESVEPGDRILLRNQTDLADNGIYVVGESGATRAADADSAEDFYYGRCVRVSGGETYAGTVWEHRTTADTITLGTTPLLFVEQGAFNSRGIPAFFNSAPEATSTP